MCGGSLRFICAKRIQKQQHSEREATKREGGEYARGEESRRSRKRKRAEDRAHGFVRERKRATATAKVDPNEQQRDRRGEVTAQVRKRSESHREREGKKRQATDSVLTRIQGQKRVRRERPGPGRTHQGEGVQSISKCERRIHARDRSGREKMKKDEVAKETGHDRAVQRMCREEWEELSEGRQKEGANGERE
eukprot:3814588-Pleurochrysis_carterae.AAC.1